MMDVMILLTLAFMYLLYCKLVKSRRKLRMALTLAQRHEDVMRVAARELLAMSCVCDAAGLEEERIRYRTLANRLSCGVGMAKKLEVL